MKKFEQKTTEEQKSEIVGKFRSGLVSATVFEKEIEFDKRKVKVYNVSVKKSYVHKDKDGKEEWKETNNYDKNDLVKLKVVIDKTIEFLYLNEE